MKAGALVERFFVAVLEQAGAVHDAAAPGVIDVMLPAALAGELGFPEHFSVTADPEAATDDAGLELLAFGSPLLDWACRVGVRVGRVAYRHVRARSLDAQAARAKLERALELDRVRLLALEPNGIKLGTVLAVHLQVQLTSDVTEERHEVVYLDAATGLTVPSWEELGAPRDADPAPVYLAPALPQRPLGELLAAGRARCEEKLGGTLERLRGELAGFRARDAARLDAYFGALRADLAKRRLSAESMKSRAAALAAEESVRRKELDARSSLAAAVTIDRLVFYETPKATFELRVQSGAHDAAIPCAVDLATGRADPFRCPSCAAATLYLAGRRDGPPRCVACRPPEVVEPAPAPRLAVPETPAAAQPPSPKPAAVAGAAELAWRDRAQLEWLAAARGELTSLVAALGLVVRAASPEVRRGVERARVLRRLDSEAVARELEREMGLPGIRDVVVTDHRPRGSGAGILAADRLTGWAAYTPAWWYETLAGTYTCAAESAARAPRGSPVRTFDPGSPHSSMISETWIDAPSGRAAWCVLLLPVVVLSALPQMGVPLAGAFAVRTEGLARIVRLLAGALGLSGRQSWLAPAFLTAAARLDEPMFARAIARVIPLAEPPPSDRWILPPEAPVPPRPARRRAPRSPRPPR